MQRRRSGFTVSDRDRSRLRQSPGSSLRQCSQHTDWGTRLSVSRNPQRTAWRHMTLRAKGAQRTDRVTRLNAPRVILWNYPGSARRWLMRDPEKISTLSVVCISFYTFFLPVIPTSLMLPSSHQWFACDAEIFRNFRSNESFIIQQLILYKKKSSTLKLRSKTRMGRAPPGPPIFF